MPSNRAPTAPLHKAVIAGDIATVRKYLSSKRIKVNHLSNGRTALSYAVSHNNYQLAKLLLEAGAIPDTPAKSTGLSPIHIASNKGDLNMVKLLVEYGANTQLQGRSPNNTWTPISAASKNNHTKVVEFLTKPYD